MRNNHTTSRWSGVLAALALLAPAVASAAAPAAVLDSVSVNDEMSVIELRGNFGPGAPKITVGGQPVKMLTNDGTFIAVRLTPGTKKGTYAVVVTRADGRSGTVQAVLDPKAPKPAPPAAVPPGPPAVVESAVLNDEGSVLNLAGHFGSGMPKVTLSGKALQPLINDGTFLAAKLPAGTAAGKYLVLVKTVDGRAGALQVVIGK
jgi:hypothetical protein